MTVATSQVIVSCVCRANLSEKLLSTIKKAGQFPLTVEDLAPRQIRVQTDEQFAATMKWHRDGYSAVVSPEVAAELVRDGAAQYEPQALLVYTRKDYLTDPDVIKMSEEHERVTKSDATLVVVAVIGENRSPRAICRNIVSGCQNEQTLVQDAQAAIKASSVFLIED